MSVYLERIIRDFSDADLHRIITDGQLAEQRTDLSAPMIALRQTWAVEASKELARRADLRRYAQVRELATAMLHKGILVDQMRDAHEYATEAAIALQ